MRQNKYYTIADGHSYNKGFENVRFTSYSFRTGKTLAHYVDGHTEPSAHTYNSCELCVKLDGWKRLTYKEAFAMIKPVKKVNDTLSKIEEYWLKDNDVIYFLPTRTFDWMITAYIHYDPNDKKVMAKCFNGENNHLSTYTLEACNKEVSDGHWRKSTKTEALLREKDNK